jgi:hypothetical protein
MIPTKIWPNSGEIQATVPVAVQATKKVGIDPVVPKKHIQVFFLFLFFFQAI